MGLKFYITEGSRHVTNVRTVLPISSQLCFGSKGNWLEGCGWISKNPKGAGLPRDWTQNLDPPWHLCRCVASTVPHQLHPVSSGQRCLALWVHGRRGSPQSSSVYSILFIVPDVCENKLDRSNLDPRVWPWHSHLWPLTQSSLRVWIKEAGSFKKVSLKLTKHQTTLLFAYCTA